MVRQIIERVAESPEAVDFINKLTVEHLKAIYAAEDDDDLLDALLEVIEYFSTQQEFNDFLEELDGRN